ncbi:MAG TPA: rhomboid family intramembrane serine protease [Spirochaetota bacterium]|nr:rhomboid family intramembrane serine protease [Spirochaetota bacterium]
MINNLKISFFFVFTLWIVFVVDLIIPIKLTSFGLLPRTPMGLVGIFTCVFLHGSLFHLISNTIPLFVLTFMVLTFYKKNSIGVFLFVITIGGLLVWIFGRTSYHIGASGLIYGLVAFLISCGIFQRNAQSIIISVIIVILYGGLIYGVFPTQSYISWEGHLFGALAGVFCGYIFRKKENSRQKEQL